MRIRPRRGGFTLLEVLLAAAIGILLMAGLYTALNLTLSHAQAGRDKVEQSTIARSLFRRMSSDVQPELAAYRPAPVGSSGGGGGAGAGGGGAGGGGGASGATGATGQSGGASSTSQGSGGSSSTSNVSGLGGPVQFNQGLQGDSGMLVLYVSRVPSELDPSWNGDNVPVVSDLRRITYWLSASGLSRQELKIATSDDAIGGLPTDLPDDPATVIAPEVQSITFQYFDGTSWQDTWDGSQPPSSGGSNPQGPPLAIAVTIEMSIPGTSTESGEAKRKTYRNVIAIPTANGTAQSSSSTTSSTGK